MFSALSADLNQSQVVGLDWCVHCGVWDPDAKPHIILKGRRREVNDVEPPEGLL